MTLEDRLTNDFLNPLVAKKKRNSNKSAKKKKIRSNKQSKKRVKK
jgi:hypothetical protein